MGLKTVRFQVDNPAPRAYTFINVAEPESLPAVDAKSSA
jgi:hypothetical protein